MAVSRKKSRGRISRGRARRWLIACAFLLAVAAALISPLFMTLLPADRLPWKDLADIGQAYGGASALLSAAALCGIVASLLVQRRQLRQELAAMERENHRDLIILALENQEFFEAMDARTASGPHGRQEAFLNLVMMYWLALWELGGIDEAELRVLAAGMFENEVSRLWWERVGGAWVGTHGRRDRRRFIATVSEELAKARPFPALLPARERQPATLPRVPGESAPGRGRQLAMLAAAAAAGGVCVTLARSLHDRGRRSRAGRGDRF
jgi:hypothetical protein